MKNYKFLFCDLDGTLIKTASGETFPNDCTDFQIRKDVLDKIKSLNKKNKLIFVAIVTNQGGVPQYTSLQDFYAKLSAIRTFVSQYIHVDAVADYCISMDKDDPCRKPNPGMLERVVSSYNAGRMRPNIPMPFEKDLALMIGDASGKKGQFSDSDLKCAENFGIDYMDVGDFLQVGV